MIDILLTVSNQPLWGNWRDRHVFNISDFVIIIIIIIIIILVG